MPQLPIIIRTVNYVGMRKTQFAVLFLFVFVLGVTYWLPGQGPSSGKATIYSGTINNLPVDAANGSLAVITDGNSLSDARTGSGAFEVLAIFDGAAKTWNPISTIPAHGAIHSGSGSTVNTSGTPVALAGTFNPSGLERLFDNSTGGRLRYIGLRSRTFSSSVHFSFTANVNNRIFNLMVGKNGVAISDAKVTHKIGAGTDVVAMSTGYLVELNTNDYLEAFVDSDGGNPTITTQHFTLTAWVVN